MAKKFQIEDDSTVFDPSVSAAKLPTDIKGGKTPRLDYMDIPVGQFVTFQQKGKGDFSRMPTDEFARMVESVRKDGILEAVIARQIGNDTFELLAGETRWTAATAAGLECIPTRVLADCDDAKAARIFAVTNLNRRNPTIRDRLYGWYIYWCNVKSKDKEAVLRDDIASLDASNLGNIQIRQIQKYYKIYNVLEEPFIRELEGNIISIDAAYAIAFLTREQRDEVLGIPMSVKQAESLKELSQAESWTKENVDKVLNRQPAVKQPYEASLHKAVKSLKKVITKRLNPAQYDNVDKIVEDALELYFTAHPEMVNEK